MPYISTPRKPRIGLSIIVPVLIVALFALGLGVILLVTAPQAPHSQTVEMPDGNSITCVTYDAAITCDWYGVYDPRLHDQVDAS